MISRTDIEGMTDAQDEALNYTVAPWPLVSIIRIGELVDIRPDGTITYGPNYSPDEAAKALWDAIARMGFARLARPSQAGDERVARLVEELRDISRLDVNQSHNGNRNDLLACEAVRIAIAALAAMDTPKGATP